MKNSKLKVQPVKKYNTPKYPSHSDKNPLEHPEILPYPFKTKVIHGLLLTGLFTTFHPNDLGVSSQNIENPFTFEKTGLPHVPSMYGTGLPDYLDSKEARTVIFKIFEQEGIPLQRNYLYHKNGQIYRLDGYNKDKQIGFAWLDGENLLDDNYTRNYWSLYAPIDTEEAIVNMWAYFNGLEKEHPELKIKPLLEELNIAAKIEDEATKTYTVTQFKHKLKTFLLSKGTIETTKDIQLAAINAFQLPEDKQVEAFELVALRHQINFIIEDEELPTFIKTFCKNSLNKFKLEDFRTVHEIVVLMEITGVNYLEGFHQEKWQSYLEQFDRDKNLTTILKFLKGLKEEMFSLQEIKHLDQQAKQEKTFIAPISMYDKRFQEDEFITFDDSIYTQISEKVKHIEELSLHLDAYNEELDKEYLKYKATKTPPLEELENQVRQYIQWAKSQGQF